MKNFKRIASLVLALTMVLCMGLPIFAAEEETTYTLTLNNALEGHAYTAYQIFAGTLSADGVLSDIVWGDGVTAAGRTALGDAETKAKALTTSAEAAAFAEEVAKYLDTAAGSATVDSDATTCKISDLKAGYYLVRNDSIPNGDDAAYTNYMMLVVKDTDANVKAGVPTGDKAITSDNEDAKITGDIAADGESNNMSIGSTVTYTLTGTVPAEASYYDYYYFIFDDTLSVGLTYNNNVTVTIDGTTATKDTDYAVYAEDVKEGNTVTGKHIQVAMLDAKAAAGKTIVVTYTATLNEKAVIGEVEGNTNTLKVVYSNDPTKKYDGTNEENKPGMPDTDTDVPTGETPDDTVRTYTTGLKLIKVDELDNTLAGATFEITGDNLVQILTVEEVTYEVNANGDYYKLTDETYTKTPPTTEYSVKVKTDNRDNGYVETTDTSRDGYREVGANGYAIATATELAGDVTLYTLVEPNVSLYDSTETKYSVKTVTYNTKTEVDNKEYTITTTTDGTIILAGLGQGEYTITETVAPSGFNELEGSIVINITWNAPDEDKGETNCEWKATKTYNSVDEDISINDVAGVFEIEIENRAGSTLPETGGIGTTIFYISGAVLILGAAVLLITKRRMNAGE